MQEKILENWKASFLSTPVFSETKSFATLSELAKHAPTLSESGILTEERVASKEDRVVPVISRIIC